MENLSTSILKRIHPESLVSSEKLSKKLKNNADIHIKFWYQNLPNDEDIDDSYYKEPFDKILKSTFEELKNLNINYIVERYKPSLSEFYELSLMYRVNVKKYNAIFENFIETLCNLFKIQRQPMMVFPNKYSTKEWGNVYWEFLHLSSILLSYAYENGMINNLLKFPTLVYNIDSILLCPKCAYHYSIVKNSDDVKQVIKSMSFGSIMISLQIFHNIITANVDKTPDYANIKNRERFLISDFALKYKCIDIQSEFNKKSTNYLKSCIDWQPTTHVLLSIILSTYCSQPFYDRTSNLLKYKLYAKNKHFSEMDFTIRNADVRPIDNSDLIYISMTEKQIQYCLMRALLLQFQDTNMSHESIEQNNRLNSALIAIYKRYNDDIRQLVSENMREPEQLEQKESILLKLDKLKTVPLDSLLYTF